MYKGRSSYNVKLYQWLTKLEMLSLDGIPYADFDDVFSRLRNIQILYVTGDMRYIRNNTLRAFSRTQLSSITISSDIVDIDKMAFGYLSSLAFLNLGNNTQLGFQNASRAWHGLQFTNITTLIFENISPYLSTLTMIRELFYQGLEKTRVRSISLNNNDIVELEAHFSKYTPLLEELSIAYNRLTHTDSLFVDISPMK